MSEGKKQNTGRFMALEGVRGIAAIMVVVFHFVYMFWAAAIVGQGLSHSRFEDNLFGNPLFVFISGSFAVSIFFILSGFVLSIGFFRKGDSESVKGQLARRYFRLMIPAAAICIFACLLISLGMNHNPDVQHFSQSAWLHRMWNLDPSIFGALYDGTLGIFLSSSEKYTEYNPVLWTMHWEFFGSLLVFSFLLLVGKLNKRWVAYLLLILLLYKSQLLGFILGMAIADLYTNGKLPQMTLKSAIPALLLALYLGGVQNTHNMFYSFIPRLSDVSSTEWAWILRSLAAAIVIFVVLMTPKISSFLEKEHISILGRYTFSLYLVHKLVLFTLTGWIFLMLRPALGYNYAAVSAFVLSLPVIALVTLLFEKYVDQPSIAFGRRFSDWFMAEDSESLLEIFHRQRYALAAKLYKIEDKYRYATETAE